MKSHGIKVYKRKPKAFSPTVEIAAIYVTVSDQILLLKKDTWGVPAGKIELNESPSAGAKRELLEETGISTDKVLPVGILYMVKPNISYTYHAFALCLDSIPEVHLSDEHCAYQWVRLGEAYHLPLMKGAKEALDFYIKQIMRYGK